VTVNSVEFLAAQVGNAETQWSLGTFGGIAEFMRDPNEPVTMTRSDKSFSAVTARRRPHRAARRFAAVRLRVHDRESWAIASRCACGKTSAP
jgi:hypothetical protein